MPKQILSYRVYWDDESFMAQVEVDYHTDKYYGDDSDGNRGVPHTFIDDVRIIQVTNEQGHDLKEIPDGLKDTILSGVDDRVLI